MNSAIRKLGDVCTYCTVGAVVTAAVLMWYELGDVSPAFSWQLRQVELSSRPTSSSAPLSAECML